MSRFANEAAPGFHHNFAASRTGTGSVMDYPFPLIDLEASGMPRVSKAYGVGLGAWDTYLVKHGCGFFDNEDVELAKVRADIRAQGFEYMSEPDSRARSYGLAEDNAPGTTSVAAKTQLAARQRLLDTLGAKNLAARQRIETDDSASHGL